MVISFSFILKISPNTRLIKFSSISVFSSEDIAASLINAPSIVLIFAGKFCARKNERIIGGSRNSCLDSCWRDG